ncbi:hypothetical protein HY745_10250 [Candidatus Desantisbacteria bacterium]|nr:hypothetical protein [Candidatus Desantisbacteria bacterium]MBI4846310.1 hypothetical protein [Candidatus Omnitrophota bacterium]
MIAIAFAIVLILIILIVVSIKSTGNIKLVFLSISTLAIIVPIALILSIKPAQQGKILPQWGKISLLFFEPKDLWEPLAQASLEQNKKEYNFVFSHKYVGNHDIEIVLSRPEIDIWKIEKNGLSLTVSIYNETNKIFSKTTSYVGAFKGLRGSGLTYLSYSLPEDLPINKELKVKIEITGNIENFINQYGSAKLIIKKSSDI